jgi:hypothetical protein
MTTARDRLLRLILKIDAASSGAVGLILLMAELLADPGLGLPTPVALAIGALLPAAWTPALWYLATRPVVPVGGAWTVIAANIVFTGLTVAVVALSWFPLTTLGTAVLLAQAAIVLVYADLQFVGLRRVRAAA